MEWREHDPYPDYPAAWSYAAGRVLVACRFYMAGQMRLQVSVERSSGFPDVMAPEF